MYMAYVGTSWKDCSKKLMISKAVGIDIQINRHRWAES
jgi:hypothetical protein